MIVSAFAILTIITASVIWHRRTAPARTPHAAAFSTTFAAALFLVSGSIGFGLQKGPPLFSDGRWSEGVIWPQINVGLAFLIAAVFCWRKAVRDTDRRLSRAID